MGHFTGKFWRKGQCPFSSRFHVSFMILEACQIFWRWFLCLDLSTSQGKLMVEVWKTKKRLFLRVFFFVAIFLLTNFGLQIGFYTSLIWDWVGYANCCRSKSWNFLNKISIEQVSNKTLVRVSIWSCNRDWFSLNQGLHSCTVNNCLNVQLSLQLFSLNVQNQ